MSMASILVRARAIHRVDYPKLSRIVDPTLALPASVAALQASNGSVLFANDEGGCVIEAIEEYNQDIPNRRCVVVQGQNGVWLYFLDDIITGWDNQVQIIEDIIYPLGVPEEVRMNRNVWAQTMDPSTERPVLRFQTDRPTGSSYTAMYPSNSFAIMYLEPYLFNINTGECNIRTVHEGAISNLIAAKYLELAANECAQFGDQQIFQNKDMKDLHARLQTRADKCREEYNKVVVKDQYDKGPHWAGWYLSLPTGWSPFHPDQIYAG